MNISTERYHTTRSIMVGCILGSILTIASTLVGAQQAEAQPYGGCKEAWQAPQSQGADDCRDLGWTVRKRVVLNPHGVIRYWNLKTCSSEDGSGSRLPCGWLGNRDGNGRGLSYYVVGPWERHRAYFLWSPNPLMDHPKREWVDPALADALAEGSSDGATTRNWEQCWTNGEKAVCPDGHREVW